MTALSAARLDEIEEFAKQHAPRSIVVFVDDLLALVRMARFANHRQGCQYLDCIQMRLKQQRKCDCGFEEAMK